MLEAGIQKLKNFFLQLCHLFSDKCTAFELITFTLLDKKVKVFFKQTWKAETNLHLLS